MSQIYLIKDLAHITGQSVETIKYYLKIGLLKEIGKTPKTNFRYFDDSTVKCLNNIRSLRIKGESIRQIKEVLEDK